MTGDEIYRRFCVRIGQAYSAFSDRTKLNRTFLDALYDVTQNKSEALTQKEYDELCFQVKTERVLLVRGNKIPTVPIVIDSIIASGNVLRVTTISDHNLALADVFTEATLDYFAKPKQAIDLNNAIIDMELYYPHKLLSYIIEDAAMKYSQNARDQALEQSSGRQMQINN